MVPKKEYLVEFITTRISEITANNKYELDSLDCFELVMSIEEFLDLEIWTTDEMDIFAEKILTGITISDMADLVLSQVNKI